jgi:hypothetical protein
VNPEDEDSVYEINDHFNLRVNPLAVKEMIAKKC